MKKYLLIVLCLSCSETETDNKRYVFITKNLYEGFLLGGIYGADEKCSQEALRIGLISQEEYTDRKYKAWISTDNENAKDRILGINNEGMRIKYYTLDGKLVGDYTNIITSNLLNPINVEPDGLKEENFMSYVWTGTKDDGVFLNPLYDCNNWDNFDENSYTGLSGASNAKDHNWTFTESPKNCIAEYKLYCFET
jgi:hypothetical protein